MSTKIYEAWRFPTPANLALTQRAVLEAAAQTRLLLAAPAVALALATDWSLTEREEDDRTPIAVLSYESVTETPRYASKKPLHRAAAAVDAINDHLTAARHPRHVSAAVDLTFQAWFGVDPQSTPEWVYLLLFHRHQEFTDATLALLPGVEECPFWDNSDRPAEVSEAEWEARRQAWGRVLPHGQPPGMFGTSVTLKAALPVAAPLDTVLGSGWGLDGTPSPNTSTAPPATSSSTGRHPPRRPRNACSYLPQLLQ